MSETCDYCGEPVDPKIRQGKGHPDDWSRDNNGVYHNRCVEDDIRRVTQENTATHLVKSPTELWCGADITERTRYTPIMPGADDPCRANCPRCLTKYAERRLYRATMETARQIDADRALREFVDTINATGGIVEGADGLAAPAADPEWCDLGEAYLKACSALGVDPIIAEMEEE